MTIIGSGAVEHRQSQRNRMLKGGVIAFSARHATLPCVVRDRSGSGARLQVQQAAIVPDTFELIVELDGLEVPAEVVWRTAKEVGIRFLATPERVAPKRAQTVTMSSPSPIRMKPILRREPRVAESAIEAVAADVQDDKPKSIGPKSIPIVVCDDDPDDRMLIDDAFRDARFRHPYSFVENGEELLKYLRGNEPYTERDKPGLVLLDLNMPRMDGRTALMHMKTDTDLRRIPVIVMTTSAAEEDIQRTYDLGVSAYIPKPNNQDGLFEVVEAIDKYWLRMVSLPTQA